MDFAWGSYSIWGGSVTYMGSIYSCKRKISENKKSCVVLEHIRSQISLTWDTSLKLANNLSADFVVKQNAQLLFFGKCTSLSMKYASPKKSIIKKKSFKCLSFKTFRWLHDHNILKLWYCINFPKKAVFEPSLLRLDHR